MEIRQVLAVLLLSAAVVVVGHTGEVDVVDIGDVLPGRPVAAKVALVGEGNGKSFYFSQALFFRFLHRITEFFVAPRPVLSTECLQG